MGSPKILFFILAILYLHSCNNSLEPSKNVSPDASATEKFYPDGIYCSVITYSNSNIGISNSYDIDVEVRNGRVELILWPNEGWLEETHFVPSLIQNGSCKFSSERGNDYTIVLGKLGGCSKTDEAKLQEDINRDIEDTTCPICGDEKDFYNEYCDNCSYVN